MDKNYEEKEIELIKLSDEDKQKKVKELKKQLEEAKKNNQEIRNKSEKLYKDFIDEYNLERELKILTHQFQVNDVILLNTYEIAQIRNLEGTYKYEVFVHDEVMKGGIGTIRTIHNKEILCHITDLILKTHKNIEYKQRGYRRINYLN